MQSSESCLLVFPLCFGLLLPLPRHQRARGSGGEEVEEEEEE
jgi:hypothetical protein